MLIEGFDHETDNVPGAYVSGNALRAGVARKGWFVFDSGPGAPQRFLTMDAGRGGGGALAIDEEISAQVNTTYVYKILPSGLTTVTAGFAFKPTTVSPASEGATFPPFASPIYALGNGTTQIATVTCDNVGAIAVNGVVGPGAPILQLDVWRYVEVTAVIAGGAGSVAIQVDGAPYIAATTVDLGSTPITTVGPCCARVPGIETYFLWDDLYVDDGGGVFFGDMQVTTLYPQADGAHTDWHPDSGTDHWPRVREHPPDDDASYIYDQTPGDKDTFEVDPLPSAFGDVFGVQLNVYARKQEPGTRTIAPLVRQAGVDHEGDVHALSTDSSFYSWMLAKDPTGAAWTNAQVNADEYGVELVS